MVMQWRVAMVVAAATNVEVPAPRLQVLTLATSDVNKNVALPL